MVNYATTSNDLSRMRGLGQKGVLLKLFPPTTGTSDTENTSLQIKAKRERALTLKGGEVDGRRGR